MGSAPGGWSQVASKIIQKGKVLSIDIKDMDPINNVEFIKSDIFADTANISNNRYYIEEARIKGGFNEAFMEPGVRAYAVNDDYTVNNKPYWVELKVSNFCNLK